MKNNNNNNTCTLIYDDAMELMSNENASYGELFDLSNTIVENYLNGNLTTDDVECMIDDGLTSAEAICDGIRAHYDNNYADNWYDYPMHEFEETEPELYVWFVNYDYDVATIYRKEEERMSEEADDENDDGSDW